MDVAALIPWCFSSHQPFTKSPSHGCAVEEYQIVINALYIPLPPYEQRQLSAKELLKGLRIDALSVVVDGTCFSVFEDRNANLFGYFYTVLLKGVMRVARTFRDKLFVFRLPPRTANKLQGFINYN